MGEGVGVGDLRVSEGVCVCVVGGGGYVWV